MIDIDRALQFMAFVHERHRIWEQRQAGQPQPWTDDPILAARKFTNTFRILDPGTQFIMTDLIDPQLGPRDQLLRLFLYRHTGRIEAWRALEMTSGYPTRESLEDVRAAWKTYRGEAKMGRRGSLRGAPPSDARSFSRPVFTSAYLVFPQSTVAGTDKLDSIIDLTERLSDNGAFDDFLAAPFQEDRFAALRRNKGVADFMSMQILTDWGYTPFAREDRENEFVVLGPGAVKGALAIDPDSKPYDTFRWVYDAVTREGTTRLGDRLPSYMDVQNCLCEFSKYVRFEGKPGKAKPYQPAHPGPQPEPVLPAHW